MEFNYLSTFINCEIIMFESSMNYLYNELFNKFICSVSQVNAGKDILGNIVYILCVSSPFNYFFCFYNLNVLDQTSR